MCKRERRVVMPVCEFLQISGILELILRVQSLSSRLAMI